jgi:phosphoadenosine phosphosulfate reductase
MYLVNKEKINRFSFDTKIVDSRVAQVFNTFKDVLVNSSFGTTSAVLLHLVSRIKPEYPIYFINTGYQFEEILDYKERLTRLLDLNVIELRPDPTEHAMTRKKQLWGRIPINVAVLTRLSHCSG